MKKILLILSLVIIFSGMSLFHLNSAKALSTPNEYININEYTIVSGLVNIDENTYYIGRKPKYINNEEDAKSILYDLFSINTTTQDINRIARFSPKDLGVREWRESEVEYCTIDITEYNNNLYIYNSYQRRCCRSNIFTLNTEDNSITRKKIGINKTQVGSIYNSFSHNDYLYFILYGKRIPSDGYYGNYIYRTDGNKWKKQKIGHKNKYKQISAFNVIQENPYIRFDHQRARIYGFKDLIKFERKNDYESKFVRYFKNIFDFNDHTYAIKFNKLKEFDQERWNKSIRKNLCPHQAHSDEVAIIQARNKLAWVVTNNGEDFYNIKFKSDFIKEFYIHNQKSYTRNGYCGSGELRPIQLGDAVGLLFHHPDNFDDLLLFTLNGKKWRYIMNPDTTDFIVKEDKVIFPDSVKNINEYPIALSETKKAKKY